jgi:phenylacetate-CoA ligase
MTSVTATSSATPVYNSWQERLTRDESHALQLRLLRKLCQWAEQRSPFYQDHWRQAGFTADQLQTLDDIRRIPYVTKRDFLADQNEAPPYGRRLAVTEGEVFKAFLTSGTTGIGQEVHCFTRGEWVTAGAAREWQFRQAGLDLGDGFAVTLPLAMQIGGPYLVNAAEKYGLRVMALSSYTTEQKVSLLERFNPHGILLTPAYAARMEDEMRKAGHPKWDGRLKAMFVVGESFTDRWIEALEAYWGVPSYEYYGTSQSGMGHAASCHLGVLHNGRRGMLHNLDPYSICEVLDPETGNPVAEDGTGEVVQTALFKYASPVIRFKTDDRVVFRSAPSCACGLPWDGILAGEVSRYDDMIKAKGQNFWPSAVHEVIDAALPGAEYRGRVFVDDTGRERIALTIELDDAARAAELADTLRTRTNVSMEIDMVPPDSLDRFEFKSRRWEDTRKTDREVIAYREKR